MSKKVMKSNSHHAIPNPTNLLEDHIRRCQELMDVISKGNELLNKKEKTLLRMAAIPFMEDVFDEAIYFLMRGNMEDFHRNLDLAERFSERIG